MKEAKDMANIVQRLIVDGKYFIFEIIYVLYNIIDEKN